MNRKDYLVIAKQKRNEEWSGFTPEEQSIAMTNLAIDLGIDSVSEAMLHKASIMKLLLASARRVKRGAPTKEMLQRKIEVLLKWAEKYGFTVKIEIL